jgi:uncharacterized XkdX family phage protein
MMRRRVLMSRYYNKVKNYYDNGNWSKRQVKDAVKKGWITAEEYKLITGEEYKEA